jgi:hypothetical protein
MDLETVTIFFKYCTIINFILLLMSTIMLRTPLVYNIHTKFGIWEGSRKAHKQLGYSMLGNYKILTIIFNAVPYLVLCCWI